MSADQYADGVSSAVAARAGGLAPQEYDLIYGALYSAVATSNAPLPQTQDFNADALTRIVVEGRLGLCTACRRPLIDHDVDLASYPWVRCRQRPARAGSAWQAWLLWVGVPLLSVGLLSWLPSAIATRRHRRHGWGPATGLLALLTFSLWSPPLDLSAVGILWLTSVIYGALQVGPWRRVEADSPPG